MSVSLCKHRFSVVPPEGSIFGPGDCIGCGITWEESQRLRAEREVRQRAASARDGECARCKQQRLLFEYQADPQWLDADPPKARLCARCWSAAAEIEARNEGATFDEVFAHGSDEELVRFLAGAR